MVMAFTTPWEQRAPMPSRLLSDDALVRMLVPRAPCIPNVYSIVTHAPFVTENVPALNVGSLERPA